MVREGMTNDWFETTLVGALLTIVAVGVIVILFGLLSISIALGGVPLLFAGLFLVTSYCVGRLWRSW